jgi:hypothetical protein
MSKDIYSKTDNKDPKKNILFRAGYATKLVTKLK